jgi:glucose-6-phosphate isomerase
MQETRVSVTAGRAWKALTAHCEQIRETHLRRLFSDDSQRAERLTVEAAGLYLDYSKNRITDETIPPLVNKAKE